MIIQPALPYEYDALEPAMSTETLHFHYDKHHTAYVEKTNELAKKAGLTGKSLEDLIAAAADKANLKLYNNAAQAWNHAFFWESMAPSATRPSAELDKATTASFGDRATLREKFIEVGVNQFGSGWVWLVADYAGVLSVTATHDAGTLALLDKGTPLLVCDVWEHAYYLDRKNDREAYLEGWFDHLANWDFAVEQFTAAMRVAKGYRVPAREMADR